VGLQNGNENKEIIKCLYIHTQVTKFTKQITHWEADIQSSIQETRTIIIVHTTARRLFLSRATWIQSPISTLLLSWSILIVFSRLSLGFPSGEFPASILCTLFFSPMQGKFPNFMLLHPITIIKFVKLTNYAAPHSAIFFSLLPFPVSYFQMFCPILFSHVILCSNVKYIKRVNYKFYILIDIWEERKSKRILNRMAASISETSPILTHREYKLHLLLSYKILELSHIFREFISNH